MAARTCSPCAINWPNDVSKFERCPICDGGLYYQMQSNPDHDTPALAMLDRIRELDAA